MVAAFALKLMTGVALMWLLMPRRHVTDGFFRIQMLVVLGLAALIVLTVDAATLGVFDSESASVAESPQISRAAGILRGLAVAVAVIAYAGHIFWKLGRRTPGAAAIYGIGLLSVCGIMVRAMSFASASPTWLIAGSDLASSAVLGATLTGMLLGHWYLTTPTMAIQPLVWFTGALAVAGALRLSSSIAAIMMTGWPEGAIRGLWMIMRLTGGAAVPIVAAVVVSRILKYRNTQSATGVLFAALIVVFMGEMAAALLERDMKLPL